MCVLVSVWAYFSLPLAKHLMNHTRGFNEKLRKYIFLYSSTIDELLGLTKFKMIATVK